MAGAIALGCIVMAAIAPALGQLSLFDTPEPTAISSRLGWNMNQMYACGNIRCSPVYLDGIRLFTVTSLPENKLNNGDNYSLSAEERARDIQNTLNKIIQAKLNHQTQNATKDGEPVKESIDVETGVGTLLGQTVVFVPEQPGLVSRKIVTITELDARYLEKSIPDLARAWRISIDRQLEIAIAERQRLSRQPLQFLQQVLHNILITIFISLSVQIIVQLIKAWDRQLRRKLKQLQHSLTHSSEAGYSEETTDLPPNRKIAIEDLWNQLNDTTVPLESIWLALPQLLLQERTFLTQQRNFFALILQLLLALQVLVWFSGAAEVVEVYPQTRVYSWFFFEVGLLLPLLWSAIITVNKVGDFFIEFWLSRWSRNGARLESSASSRYAIRAHTYATALTQCTTFAFAIVGILSTLHMLGFSPTVLASFGAIAVVVTYFFQNTVNDLLNGALILWNDRYAIGDVVHINGISGSVEKLNLYMTQLRNLDGDVITIPNGSISIVRNMTKDWSRVNFSITINYEADLMRAIAAIEETAATMKQEPQWQAVITDNLEMLGVDNISHEGVLIRALMKTEPMKQWEVARELRRRVKLALQNEGIAIGVPQQSVHLPDCSRLE
ncbi:mechanosensitive ion channel family protein [Roseofilum casamattae]|uniref:Mechanosensitive ion channel family protein n=1 Tax=Roseofilum casamattae BLCC-M143 TaxID=3022442 RepID=A0ABT7C1Y9_9CYAN|nr:mechanosensitive ion channel family protein [Roseofilum casamattae]MDJ1185472.1 mechanosensitive ion channel family protein [Roseofilum casamattae BLCC-M143]